MTLQRKSFYLINFFLAEFSTPPSPRTRASTLLTHSCTSNNQFYGNNSSKILPSPLKSHHTFNQNFALMSIMQQQQFLHHHTSIPYGREVLSNENHQIFDG